MECRKTALRPEPASAIFRMHGAVRFATWARKISWRSSFKLRIRADRRTVSLRDHNQFTAIHHYCCPVPIAKPVQMAETRLIQQRGEFVLTAKPQSALGYQLVPRHPELVVRRKAHD